VNKIFDMIMMMVYAEDGLMVYQCDDHSSSFLFCFDIHAQVAEYERPCIGKSGLLFRNVIM